MHVTSWKQVPCREPQQHSFPTPAATRTPAAPCNALPLWPFRRQPSPPTPHATLSHALPSLNTLPAATRARLQSLQTILSCSENSVLRMVRLYPRILDMAPQDVQMRLLDLKEHLPGSDVLTMVETAPAALLDGTRQQVTRQVAAAAAVLRAGLVGARLERMFEEVPTVLMEPVESLQEGLRELHDLWDVDEAALAASEPRELAFAVICLSKRGPPPHV